MNLSSEEDFFATYFCDFVAFMTDLNQILNFLPLSETIATAGQPTVEQFSDIKQAGYQTIVNLAPATSTYAIPNEQEIVESQGMQYVHIPVVWEEPTQEDFERFVSTINRHVNQKVFVHCAMNMRVSAFMYLYRRIQESVSDEQAKQDLHRIWMPNDTWQTFIDQVLERNLGID
ncbi:protein tyrosine phosphatase family protein [Egbenema bharatensis]|uniref:protein tyrosine phosphatase family protein n=1 Tax=Egbenema bharatensis TaxID=3463334 RepID=UPI003A8539E7